MDPMTLEIIKKNQISNTKPDLESLTDFNKDMIGKNLREEFSNKVK
jgi:hypothetical protein